MNSDSLRIELDSVEVRHLSVVGTIAGVAPLLAAARNGPGIGQLQCVSEGLLAWRAPGSDAFGDAVDCSAGGVFVLWDSGDGGKWIRVDVHPSYLVAGETADVFLADRYNNEVAGPDVDASEAQAGDQRDYQLSLRNAGDSDMHDVAVWLDPSADARTSISLDGVAWASPTSENDGLAIPNLPAGDAIPLYLRRTVVAGEASNVRQLVFFRVAFDALPDLT